MRDVSLAEASWSHLESGLGETAELQIHRLYVQCKNIFFFFFFFVHSEPLAVKSHCLNCKLNHGCQSEEVLLLIFAGCILSIKLAFQHSLSTVYIL